MERWVLYRRVVGIARQIKCYSYETDKAPKIFSMILLLSLILQELFCEPHCLLFEHKTESKAPEQADQMTVFPSSPAGKLLV